MKTPVIHPGAPEMILDDDPDLARALGKLGSRPASLPCNSHVAIICHFHKILRHANEHDLASALHPPISLTFVTRGTNWMKLQTQWVFFRQFLETAAGVFGLQQPASSLTIPSPSRPNQGPTLRCPSGKDSAAATYISVWPQKAPLCYRAFLA